MTTLRLTIVAFAVWSAPVAKGRTQEIIYHADSTKIANAAESGARLVHWVETVRGAGQHVIYVRNLTTRPVRVTSYEIYECMNLRGRACGVHSPGPVVAPGKTVRLIIIAFGVGIAPGSYRYRLQAAFADSTTADTSHD